MQSSIYLIVGSGHPEFVRQNPDASGGPATAGRVSGLHGGGFIALLDVHRICLSKLAFARILTPNEHLSPP
jgi:hypothetical protein